MDRANIVALGRGLERFLLPNACVACDRGVGSWLPDALVCSICIARLERVTGGCPRCHQPLPLIGPCRACAEWCEALHTVASAVWMTDQARAMIHHLKYEGLWRIANDLSRVMIRCLGSPPPGALVPIPLGADRLRSRGYNQAAALAGAVAHDWDREIRGDLLHRVSETRSQTTVMASQRADNVANAFRATPRDAARPPVILVDDVFTTGATLASAASALARAGWTEIHAVTFARAKPYEVSIAQGIPRTTVRN